MTASINNMSQKDKLLEAITRSLPYLPAESQSLVKSMLEPTNVAILLSTLVIWAGSHFIGIGEIIDVILLATGVIILGFSVFDGASELSTFTTTASNATTDTQLTDAAQHFAKAVTILGVSVISAILLRGSAKPVATRGLPRYKSMPNVGKPPSTVKPRITRPQRLSAGTLGETDAWGNIAVSRSQSLTEQRLTLYHEWVHSVLSPRFKMFRRFRAELRFSGYEKSALLRYLEEALAESFAQLKVHGLKKVIVGIRFPISHGYLTISELVAEGIAIGNIIVSGTIYKVYVNHGSWKKVTG